MDIPVLKYLDILIGLAVVIFLGATVVASLNQFVLWLLRFRSRTLCTAIEELLVEIGPSLRGSDARAMAETVLRHPLLGQSPGPLGRLFHRVWNAFLSSLAPQRHRLPATRRADVIQRHELARILIEWAGGEGPLVSDYPDLRTKLAGVLERNGVCAPDKVIEAIRFKALENEREEPREPSHWWTERALLETVPSAFLAKIHGSFDNAMRRATDAFTVQAKFAASLVALILAFSIQLDALGLVRRLSVDEGLRSSLLEEAKVLSARLGNQSPAQEPNGEPQEDRGAATPAEDGAASRPEEETGPNSSSDEEMERARGALREIDATLALLRQPKYSAIPETFIWQAVEHRTVCLQREAEAWSGTLQVGADEYDLTGSLRSIHGLERAILNAKAPVYLYPAEKGGRGCLDIVAGSPGVSASGLEIREATTDPALVVADSTRAIDWNGVLRRTPGILFSWILLSLGAPFWFELLKNFLKLRSVLARKDERERVARESEEKKPEGKRASERPSGNREEGEAGDFGRLEAVG